MSNAVADNERMGLAHLVSQQESLSPLISDLDKSIYRIFTSEGGVLKHGERIRGQHKSETDNFFNCHFNLVLLHGSSEGMRGTREGLI